MSVDPAMSNFRPDGQRSSSTLNSNAKKIKKNSVSRITSKITRKIFGKSEYYTGNHLRSGTPVRTLTEEEERYIKLKEKAERFRVLIIGGANAGKTTILKKICNTTDQPEIYNSYGSRIDGSTLEPNITRGEHDIKNEMIFRSNSTLVFHDSQGFEAGGTDEFRKVKDFVTDCAKSKRMKNQVHVIWYCVAMDDDRPITYAEEQFFSVSGTGKVPVVVVFTKCEALEIKVIGALEDAGHDFDEAVQNAPKHVEEYQKNIQHRFETMAYPPKGYVFLQEMEKPKMNCEALVRCTADVLDSSILQGLFISTQQNNLELALEHSLRRSINIALLSEGVAISSKFIIEMFKNVLEYFPFHHSNDYHYFWDFYYYNLERDRELDLNERYHNLQDLVVPCVVRSLEQLVSSFNPPSLNIKLALASALPIIAEHLSVLWQSSSVSPSVIPPTITLYQCSPCHSNIMAAVNNVLSEYDNTSPNRYQYVLSRDLLPIVMENRLDKSSL